MSKDKKTILLVTESSQGHHIAFMELFLLSLRSLGCQVVALMPQSDLLYAHMQRKGSLIDRIIFEDYHNQIDPTSGFGKFNAAVTALRRWLLLGKVTKSIEKRHKVKFDLVFLAFADVYIANYLPYQLVDYLFRYNWSGLYFHPKFLRFTPEEGRHKSGISSIDYVFRSKKCKAVAIHDDKLLDSLAFRLDKPIVFFPEIADLTEPDFSNPFYKLIKEGAKGRKTIGLVGCEKRKGFHTLKRLADRNPEGYLFVFAGRFMPEGYTKDEQIEYEGFLRDVPSNVIYYPDYLLEGKEVNSFLAALDIVYIVYSGFTSTSNFNTKAAFLRKPVLATEKYIIGDETREFCLGVTVKEDDVDDLQNALPRLQKKIESETFQYEKYLHKHSLSKLDAGFLSLLNQ